MEMHKEGKNSSGKLRMFPVRSKEATPGLLLERPYLNAMCFTFLCVLLVILLFEMFLGMVLKCHLVLFSASRL